MTKAKCRMTNVWNALTFVILHWSFVIAAAPAFDSLYPAGGQIGARVEAHAKTQPALFWHTPAAYGQGSTHPF